MKSSFSVFAILLFCSLSQAKNSVLSLGPTIDNEGRPTILKSGHAVGAQALANAKGKAKESVTESSVIDLNQK